MDLRIVKSKPEVLISHKNNLNPSSFKLAIAISKKVSKKSVVRNRIRRKLHENFLKNFKEENNHVPYWVLVNLKSGYSTNTENDLLSEFQFLISKTGVLK